MLYYCKNDNKVERTGIKVQTGLRLEPALYNKLKTEARKDGRSFNSYVEKILSSFMEREFPKLPFKVSDEILCLGETLPHYSGKELAEDERLAYLLSK